MKEQSPANRTVLVVGETPVARRVCATLELEHTALVRHLVSPTDSELKGALAGNVVAAAVLIRDDVAALRYALALAHLEAALPLTVTIFDTTIAGQLRAFLPQATIFSPAALAVPSLAGPCLGRGQLAVFRGAEGHAEWRLSDGELRSRTVSVRPNRIRKAFAVLRPMGTRHHDPGTRLLLLGLLGLTSLLVTDWAWLVFDGHRVDEALLQSARVVATVGPGSGPGRGFYAIASSVGMLLAMVFTALFTAGLVDRLIEPRLLTLIGSRTVPKSGHVIVVGMGQVGVRLAAELKMLGVPVLGVERDRKAPQLSLARSLNIPVIIGQGTERRVLERLRLEKCRALAAVASDDLDNIAVAVAAVAVSRQTRVVLRAGEQEAIAETRSLLPLGVIKDVTEIAATYVVTRLTQDEPRAVIAGPDGIYVVRDGRRPEIIHVRSHAACTHRPQGADE